MTRSILITGAAKRIGRHLAEGLAQDGWRVFVHYNSSRTEAEAVVAALQTTGAEAYAVQGDLATPDGPQQVMEQCESVTALINNASLFGFDTASTFTADGFDAHMHANTRGPVLLAQAFAAQLPAGETGVVINLLDQKLWNLNPDFFTYTLSKQALEGATRLLAIALAPRIRVVGLAPGITLQSGDQTPEEFAAAHRQTPLGISSTPDDLLLATRYILSAPTLTGQTLVVDGGQHLLPRPRDVMFEVRQ